MKPQIYIFNVSENQLENKEETEQQIQNVILASEARPESIDSEQARMTPSFLYLNAKLENDVLTLSPEEQKKYLNQYKLNDTGLNRLIKKSYEILGLISFLTAGILEARAWTIIKGTLAPQASGTIHTDFEKKFIKADICTYQDFIDNNGWIGAREVGKVVSAGKDYIMRDGDVVEFKIGV